MAESIKSEWWDTTTLCKVFNMEGAMSILDSTEKIAQHNFIGGMTGHKHSEEAKRKMSESHIGRKRPNLHKGGSVISPTGEIVHFNAIAHFCKEHKLSFGHVSEMMNGKRRSVKGWRKA